MRLAMYHVIYSVQPLNVFKILSMCSLIGCWGYDVVSFQDDKNYKTTPPTILDHSWEYEIFQFIPLGLNMNLFK